MYHGKLFTTRSGANLDEVKSLLQKSLRRKDEKRVAQSYNELVYKVRDEESGKLVRKDQLPWGCIITYLFEDHCLVDTASLDTLYKTFQSKQKELFLKYLMKMRTSRIAACLPVYAMGMLAPEFDSEIVVPHFATGLFDQTRQKYLHVDADKVMAHILKAWKDGNAESLIYYSMIINMVCEIERATLTEKAKNLIQGQMDRKGNTSFGASHVIISALLHPQLLQGEVIIDMDMRRFLHLCLRFCSVSDSLETRRNAYQRLILFSIVARKIHSKEIDTSPVTGVGHIDWNAVSLLEDMPDYAVDKHTYRGKKGCGTKQYRQQGDMPDQKYESFHGHREKKDIHNFFNDGSITYQTSLPTNPYWEATQHMYISSPKDKQKTMYMAPIFYRKLVSQRKEMFVSSHGGMLPLLQKPTSSNKVYTRIDLLGNKVVKGPYQLAKYNLLVDFHKRMRQLGDVHTLEVEEDYPYIKFPLLRGKCSVEVSKITFEDHIAKITAQDVDFVTRDSLGIQQVHRMSSQQIQSLPLTLWVHFALRFALNIGDSGLYNAISDGRQVVGIDMEEMRKDVDESKFESVCDFLFSKKPSYDVCKSIEDVISENKEDLVHLMFPVLGHAVMKEPKGSKVITRLNKFITFVKQM